jgi:hypothetical protein
MLIFASIALSCGERPKVERRRGGRAVPNKYLLAAILAAAAIAMYASIFVKLAGQ